MTRNHHSHTLLNYFYTYSKPCLIPCRTVKSKQAHARTHGHTHAEPKSSCRPLSGSRPSSFPRRKEDNSEPRMSQTDRVVFLQHPPFPDPKPLRPATTTPPRQSRFRIPGTSLNLSPCPPIRSSNKPSTSGRWTSFWCVVRSIHIPIQETILPASCDETGPRSRFSCCSCDFPRTERGGSTSP